MQWPFSLDGYFHKSAEPFITRIETHPSQGRRDQHYGGLNSAELDAIVTGLERRLLSFAHWGATQLHFIGPPNGRTEQPPVSGAGDAHTERRDEIDESCSQQHRWRQLEHSRCGRDY